MTVTYTHKVANARLGGFSSLLIRWKGSVYKIFYKEFLIYIICYTGLSLLYRFLLDGDSKTYFEKLCLQFHHYTDLVPISFVLGFYVSIVVGRWWSQYENLPFPDSMMIMLGSCLHGTDDRGRLLRRTLLRYLNLAQVLTYRCVSTAVYKRFPTMQHVVAAGIMTKTELEQYDDVKSVNLKYWVPIMWFSNILTKARQEGRIYDDMTFKMLMEDLIKFRSCCGSLVGYDWISVPLVYTQVVTVAVYMFFMSTLLSRQYLDVSLHYPGNEVDLYVPIFTIGQFFFYMGWLKVAEQLINPFGEDDDDFEVNFCIDRNMEVSMIVADQMYGKHPKLEKDKFWSMEKFDIPYTAAAANHKVEPYMGSTFDMRVDKDIGNFEKNDTSRGEKLAAVDEHSGDAVNRKNDVNLGKDAKTGRVLSSGQNSTFSTQPVELHRLRQVDRIQLLDLKRHNSSSGSDDDRSSSPRSPLLKPQSNRRDAEQSSARNSKTSIASAAAQSDEDDPNDGEKENGDDDRKEILNFAPVLDSNANLAGTLEKKRDAVQKSGAIAKSSQATSTVRAKNSPKRRPSDYEESTESLYGPRPPVLFQADLGNDTDEDRRNAERRSYLARKRRTRNFLNRRKRPYRDVRKQRHRHWANAYGAASEATSVHSDTDVGSGPNAGDSPYGSTLSFSTSIPSPKPLRWAYKSKTRNIYGDDTSVYSPSGTDGDITDGVTPFFSPSALSTIRESKTPKPNDSIGARPGGASARTSASKPSREIATPYADDLRKRLQVIPNPAPATFSHPKNARGVAKDNLSVRVAAPASDTPLTKKGRLLAGQPARAEKAKKFLPEQSGLRIKSSSSGRKRQKVMDAKEKLVRDRSDGEGDHLPTQAPSTPSTKSARSSGGLLNAFKTWNARRKETRTRLKESVAKQQSAMRANRSEGDVTLLSRENVELGDVVVCDDTISLVGKYSVANRSKSEDWSGLQAIAAKQSHEEADDASSTLQRKSPGRRSFGAPEKSAPLFGSESLPAGRVTWENECLTAAESRRPKSSRPTSLSIENALSSRFLAGEADKNKVALDESCEKDADILQVKDDQAKTKPFPLKRAADAPVKVEASDPESGNSTVCAEHETESTDMGAGDAACVAGDVISRNATERDRLLCPDPTSEEDKDSRAMSALDHFQDDYVDQLSLPDDGYQTSSSVATETCEPRSDRSTAVFTLDAIPENSGSDEEDVMGVKDINDAGVQPLVDVVKNAVGNAKDEFSPGFKGDFVDDLKTERV